MASLTLTPQPTPNPNAYKFVANRTIHEGVAQTFYNAEAAGSHPVAAQLFAIEGVTGVMLLNDFCSVNKSPDATWDTLIPRVEAVLTKALNI